LAFYATYNSDWAITTNYFYTVEFYSSGVWLPIRWPEDFAFISIPGPIIEPHSSIYIQKQLPNLVPFPPPYPLPLEEGLYRIRIAVGIHHRSGTEHDVVAEFYVTESNVQ